MSEFGLFEAKNKLSELVERAATGEEVVITKHGRPTARIVAYASPDADAAAQERRRRHSQSLERLRHLRPAPGSALSIEQILEARHEGHRY